MEKVLPMSPNTRYPCLRSLHPARGEGTLEAALKVVNERALASIAQLARKAPRDDRYFRLRRVV